MPFSIVFILLSIQRQPRTGATNIVRMMEFLNHRQYFKGIFCSSPIAIQIIIICTQLKGSLSQMFQAHYNFISQFPMSHNFSSASLLPQGRTYKPIEFYIKRNNSPLAETTKKISIDSQDSQRNKDKKFYYRHTVTPENIQLKNTVTQGLIREERTSAAAMFGAFLKKDKNNNKTFAHHHNNTSPEPSSNIKTSQVQSNLEATGSTLKSFMQTTTLDPPNRRHFSPQLKLKMSVDRSFPHVKREIKSSHQFYTQKSVQLMQQQLQILRDQNSLLRKQLQEIKNQLLYGVPTKKEQIISTLRDTIKKEDATIKELKIKLDIANKKLFSLHSMLQSKDDELNLLGHKLAQLEKESSELKVKNNEKYESIRNKIQTIVQSYDSLEEKYRRHEEQWQQVKEQWQEEKSIYQHRIQFLQTYISNNP